MTITQIVLPKAGVLDPATHHQTPEPARARPSSPVDMTAMRRGRHGVTDAELYSVRPGRAVITSSYRVRAAVPALEPGSSHLRTQGHRRSAF